MKTIAERGKLKSYCIRTSRMFTSVLAEAEDGAEYTLCWPYVPTEEEIREAWKTYKYWKAI